MENILINYLTFSVLIFLVGLLYVYVNVNKQMNLPPGPRGWSIIGNLLDIGSEPYKTFVKMGQSYGDMFTIYFGSQRAVVINNPKLIQEAFSKLEFCGRPCMKHDLDRMGGKRRGLIFTNGLLWSRQRRFILQNLREFGFGKMSMETLVLNEIQELMQIFKKEAEVNNSKSIALSNQYYYRSALNLVWLMVAGSRFPHDDQRFMVMRGSSQKSINSAQIVGMLVFCPWLCKIWEWIYGDAVIKPKAILDFMYEVIQKHKETLSDGEPRDLIDVYLHEINDMDEDQREEAESNLLIVIFDLFVSSPSSLNFLLTWLSVLLAIYPDIQRNIQNEITNIVGTSRSVSIADRNQMPYTSAVIKELIRFTQKSTANGSTFHQMTADTIFHGYNIPKNTLIIPNFYYCMQNPDIFASPHKFQPNRFLDENTLIKYTEWMPFSTGKRDCPGKGIALNELFLYTTNIFQKYNVQLDREKHPMPIVLDYYNITMTNPTTFHVIFDERIQSTL